MIRFLLRRLLIAIPTLLLVVTIAFFMMRAAPGGPFDSNRKLPAEVERNLRVQYGLDKPIAVQYLTYLAGVAHGDLGPSLKYQGRSVLDIIRQGFPTSLRLGLSALALGGGLGVGFGILGALRQNAATDQVVTALAILGI